MIIVRLKGGMGNQMFQYAFGRRMAKRLDTELCLDLSLLLDRAKKDMVFREYDLDIFELEARFLTNPSLLRMIYKTKSSSIGNWTKKWVTGGYEEVKEAHFHLIQNLIDAPKDDTIYNGWWQSEGYFEDISSEIRAAFRFQDAPLTVSTDLFKQIAETNSVCLNVRRTDFLKTPDLNTTNLNYFQKASSYITDKVEQPHFFVFSDDIAWCRKNIKVEGCPVTVVGHEHKGRKFGNYLQLMKACKHYIIPNSSFAWWATWLNEQEEKIVIAPKHWFADTKYDTTDLVPANWIRF